MQKKNFWQIYFGKDPFSKAEFIKAWIGWWVIAIVLLGVLSICTSLNLRGSSRSGEAQQRNRSDHTRRH